MRVFFWLPLCTLIPVASVLAQQADTTQAYALESIVVTADRSESMLAASTGSVSVMTASELRRLPGVARLGDALRQIPGFAMLSLDGLGLDPQATVRGFYGGGETEYVLVLLDGRPINNMEMGLINWSQIPLAAIKSIEVIRGGASSLYGDAAVGGVLNVVTNKAEAGAEGLQASISTGAYRTYLGDAAVRSSVQGKPFAAFGSLLRTDGFREHSAREAGSVGVSLGLLQGEGYEVMLSGLGHWRQYDVPGPLTVAEIDASRVQVSPFYQFDRVDENTIRATLDGRRALSASSVLTGAISGEWRQSDLVRTLPLAAAFADTKAREVATRRFFGSVQLVAENLVMGADKLTVGFDGKFGGLDNAYYEMLTGTIGDYASFSGERGGISTEGDGSRRAAAGFVQYDMVPFARLRTTLGGRYDSISDRYEAATGESRAASHSAFSPKVGLNLALARSSRYVGHVYANYLGIFKAATLDQLYDQRILPVPFPPFGITISNSELKPQRGTSFEFGAYQRVAFTHTVASELTLSVYQVNMKDELDFSFETFSYANIASSKHSGLESGLRLYVGEHAAAHINYTLQNVTYQEGDNKGNYVKGVPRDYLNMGVTARLPKALSVGVVLHSTARMYLDDANTMPLDDYSTVDAMIAHQRHSFTIRLEFTNLLDADYSTTGFPDPDSASESGVVFLYPAAGRVLRLGVSVSL